MRTRLCFTQPRNPKLCTMGGLHFTPLNRLAYKIYQDTQHILDFWLTPLFLPLSNPPFYPTTFKISGSVGMREKYCFLKVAVYNCALFADVKVLSYSTTSERKLLSMNVEIATSHATIDSCLTSQIAQLRASCVEFACGSDVHVTVQSRHGQTETKDCRYWSSSSSIPWNRPCHNLTSFQQVTRCYLGDSEEPGSMIDPYRGTAVTFTCQS